MVKVTDKTNWFFCGVTTVIFSDPVIILESFDSSSCILGPIPIKVGVWFIIVSIQLMNNILIIIYLKYKQLYSCESPGTFQGQGINGWKFWRSIRKWRGTGQIIISESGGGTICSYRCKKMDHYSNSKRVTPWDGDALLDVLLKILEASV